jgi:hypothetical protein
VIGYGAPALNKVRHEVDSAQALHRFPKSSLQKKVIDPVEN